MPLRGSGICNNNYCKFTNESIAARIFKNRLAFGKVTGKSLVSCFLVYCVYMFYAFIFLII